MNTTNFFLSALLILIMAAPPVIAQFTSLEVSQNPITVVSIKSNPINGMKVSLSGIIRRWIDQERCTFSDGTGKITLKIDDPKDSIAPNTKVKITGKVKVEGASVEIEVESLQFL